MPIVNYNKKFNEALKIMNKKKLGIVVVTKNQKIEGLITDGNLRRGMKLNIKERKLENFTTKNPLVVNESMPASKTLGIMSEKQITSLLVVSDKDYKKNNKVLKGIIHIHFLLQTGIKWLKEKKS